MIVGKIWCFCSKNDVTARNTPPTRTGWVRMHVNLAIRFYSAMVNFAGKVADGNTDAFTAGAGANMTRVVR